MPDLKQTILIVEDEVTLQKTLMEALIGEGYNVLSASDGKRGLEMVLQSKPDLVLLDLILPQMSGFEVLERIKSEEKTKDIPVIILTNLGEVPDVQRVLDLGATTYLVKSNYELADIIGKVKETLKS